MRCPSIVLALVPPSLGCPPDVGCSEADLQANQCADDKQQRAYGLGVATAKETSPELEQLQQDVATLLTAKTAMESRLAALEAKDSSQDTTATDLGTRLSALEGQVSQNEQQQSSDLADLEDRLTQDIADGDVATLAAAVDYTDSSVATILQTLSTQDGRITTIEGSYLTQASATSTYATLGTTTALDQRLTTAEGSINDQQRRLSDVEAGIADPSSIGLVSRLPEDATTPQVTTWAIPDAAALETALSELDSYLIPSGNTLILQLQDGVIYNFASAVHFHHPSGGRVILESQSGDPSQVILQFNGSDGLVIDEGSTLAKSTG